MLLEEVESTRPKRWWGLIVRLALSGALLGYLLSRLDRGALSDAVRNVQVSGWLLGVLLYLASQVLSAIRWGSLARPIGFQLPWLRFGQLYFEGMFFSLCLPSSIGGDVIKAIRLGTDRRSRLLAACTVVADRAAGLLAILIIGLTALVQRNYSLSLVQSLGIGALLAIFILVATRIGFALLDWPTGRIPKHHPVAKFLEELLPYHHHPYVFWGGIAWGMAVQGLNVVTVMALGSALGLDLPAEAYCIAVPLVALTTALPISLNGVGIREGGLVWVLSTYGLSEASGIALGLLWFSVIVATGLIGGLVYLFGPPLNRPADRLSNNVPENSESGSTLCSASSSFDLRH